MKRKTSKRKKKHEFVQARPSAVYEFELCHFSILIYSFQFHINLDRQVHRLKSWIFISLDWPGGNCAEMTETSAKGSLTSS